MSHQPDADTGGRPSPSPARLDATVLLRELNHRVKNNFQIIVSLMHLRKRAVETPDRDDMRFIEEHIQSMSAAYRLVYDTTSMVDVSLSALVLDVSTGLRNIAVLPEEQTAVRFSGPESRIGLDHAVALSLFLAVLLPPSLDLSRTTGGSVTVEVAVGDGIVDLATTADGFAPPPLDSLRSRLITAYSAQLDGTLSLRDGAHSLRFRPHLPPLRLGLPSQ